MRLTAKFPNFTAVYDGVRLREFVKHVETLFARVDVDTTRGAHTHTSSFTFDINDDVVLADTTSAAVVATLPEISDEMVRDKREFEVVLIAGANKLSVVPSGTDTAVGATEVYTYVQWTALRFRATTGNWVLI